jgi:hypothetical protein
MKRIAVWAAVSLAAVCAVAPLTARADTDVYVGVNLGSVQEFYQPLQAHGVWIQTANYGQCWRPAYVGAGWRPYTNGSWVWTNYGWYWTTTEPWGWATYHYGRWVLDSYYGWVWVPDVEWAPSWVSWREGGGYIGWAPMPPRCSWGNGGYFVYREDWIAPSWFVYIGIGNFCRPITPRYCVPHHHVHHQTVNITNIKQVNNIVINNGPSVERVRRENRQHMREANLNRVVAGGMADVERRVPPAMQERQKNQERTGGYAGGRPQTTTPPPTRVSRRDLPDHGGFTAPIKVKEIPSNNKPAQRPVVIRPQPERREVNNLRQPAEYPVVPSRAQAPKKQMPPSRVERPQRGAPVAVPAQPTEQQQVQQSKDQRGGESKRVGRGNRGN